MGDATDVVIRDSRPEDLPAILSLLSRAFPHEDLRPLVTGLLADPGAEPRLSLLAEAQGTLAGHVLFTAARIEQRPGLSAALLAPLAADPAMQRRGIGSGLVREGLSRLRRSGTAVVAVLGDPAYYGRFGFGPASGLGLAPPFPLVPEAAAAWQALSLVPGRPVAGRLVPAAAFDVPSLWEPPPGD